MFGKQMEHSVRVGVLGGSHWRLDGIGPGHLFLDAGHFRYHANAAAKLVLAGLGIGIGGKSAFAGLDAGAGFWPVSAGAAWPAAAGHLRRAAGLITAAEITMPQRAAPVLSLAMAIETVPGLEQRQQPCVCGCRSG